MSVVRKYWFPIVAGVLVLAFAIGISYWFWWGYTRLPNIMRAPDATLQTLDGKEVSIHDTQGKVRVVEFYYANCPDICPLTTANMVQVQNRLKEKGLFGKDVEFISITFDPKNDTPERKSRPRRRPMDSACLWKRKRTARGCIPRRRCSWSMRRTTSAKCTRWAKR